MKFRVSVSKWMRGSRDWNGSVLESHTGQRCCLGFACKQAGVKRALLNDELYPEPRNLWEVCGEEDRECLVAAGLVTKRGDNTRFSLEAMSINDEEGTSLKERQKQLKELAKRFGHSFKFTR